MSKGGKSKGPGKAPDPKGTRGDDVLNGNDRDNRIDGGKGDDQIFGNGGNDWLRGGKGDDLLDGGTGNDRLQGDKGDDFLYGGDGNDILFGNQGRDILLGGAGNDTLYGDDKSHGFGGWHSKFWFFGSPTGYDDYLDGGAGSDKVYGGKGNDIANYTWAENLGSRDFYDGGRGFDTLQLSLTYGEFALDSVQQDIARYESFLDSHANPHKHNGRDFHFESFNLKASNFEALNVRLVNTGPVAGDDAGATDEDTPLTVSAANGLFANDSDPDRLDVISLVSFDAASAFGATVMVSADGSYSYDPTAVPGFQALQAGESAFDSFSYTIRDLAGATSTATVTIEVVGVNDAPVANDDGPFVMRPTQTLALIGADLVANDFDIDGDALSVSNFFSTSAQGGTIANPAFDQFVYTPPALFRGFDSFVIVVSDGKGGFSESTVTVEVVNTDPDANDDGPYVIRPGQELNLAGADLIANDTDADGDGLSVSNFFATSTQGGTIENPAFDLFVYTPPAAFTGTDSFDIIVTDGYGGYSTSTVFVEVVNTAPDTTDDGPFTIRPGQTLALIGADLVANDTDADGDALSVSNFFSTSAAGGTIENPAFDQFVYTPPADFTGADSFGIVVADGYGGFTESTVTINVVNTAPDTTDDGPFVVTAGNTLTLIGASLVANDTDADGDALSVSNFFATSAQGGSITNPSFDQFVYTPPADFTGTDSFDIIVADGFGGFTNSTVTINVVADDPPPPPPPQGSNAVLPSVSPAAADALSYYIHFEGISGQSWLELGSFSFGIENSGAHSGGGGAGAGKVQVTDVVSALGSGATTTALLNAIGSGKILGDVEIEVYRTGDAAKDRLLAEYKFSEVVLTGLDSHGGDGLANDVSFDYAGFGQRFINFDNKTGQPTGETTTSWSLVQNDPGGGVLLPQGGAQAQDRMPEAQVGDNVQLEYFVRFDGISGWLELEGYSFGIDNSSSTATSGGGGAGISTATGVALSLGGSAALTSLTGSLLAGKHLANVEIEVYRTGLETKDALIEEFRFTDVTLSGLNSGNAIQNLLTFDYGQITHVHRQVDSKGVATTTNAGWDFAANEPEPVPGAVADALNVVPLDSVPSGADLEYYIHFEGVSGSQWLQLGSFSFGVENSGAQSGGGGAGKVQVTDVVSALGSSATTTALLGTIGAGKILSDVEIEVYRPGDGKDQLLAEYKFSGVVLTGLNNSGNEEQIGTDVSFDYLGFGQRHISFDSKTGLPNGEAVVSWDFINNTAGAGGLLPQSGTQATALPAESQSAGPNLEYYVRFDGFTGWLELDGFSLDIASSLTLGGGGAQIGKATAGDVALSLGASTVLTGLTGSLLAGKQLQNVEIEVYRSGLQTKDALIEEYRFTDVTLSSLQSQNASGNLLAFDYGQITHAHRGVDSKGVATTTNAGWDFIANEPEPVPAATADALGIVPVVSTPAGADLDYYIRFEGISGQEWLQLGSFNFALEHSGGGLIGGGGGAGKVSASDVSSALGSSATATRLLEALGSGQMLDGVEIEVYRSGLESKDQLLAEYRFSDVVLTGLNSFGAGTTIGNDLTFDFSGFGQRQLGFDNKTGQQTGETTASWDFSTNTAGGGILLPQAGGQAAMQMPEPQITDGSQLDYYVRFDGVNGWLQLETFQFGGSNSIVLMPGGGAGAGVSTANGASLTLGASAALTALTGNVFSGKHLEEIEIEVYRSGLESKDILIDEFRFEDVTISGLHSANAVSNLLTFDFEKVSHAHRGMDGKGGPGDFTSSGWDFAQNVEFSGPNPTPDVDII